MVTETVLIFPCQTHSQTQHLMIGGDMNAQICKDGNNEYCSHYSPKEMLNIAKFSLEKSFVYIENKFLKKKEPMDSHQRKYL